MAAVYSTVPRNSDGGGGPISHQKYQRTYQPYVFQPNFLKQQVRQRQDGMDKSIRSMQPSSFSESNQSGYNQHADGGINEEITKRKSGRKVIDWTSSCVLYVERRRWQRELLDVPTLLPDPSYSLEMQATMAYRHCPVSSIATKFVRSATNKQKCPVYKVVWTPDGRRLVTGSASGEFTLWNGTAFNFETILQAHDSPVRAMAWSHNDAWLITGDHQGYIKYWQLNMNNVKMYQAHKDQACRSVCFGPTDNKFATASDDGTVRVWDFHTCKEEHILRGHGADVKQVDWHPQKSLIASASKDLQTPVKLWDPKSGQSLCTLHAHKGTVMDIKWNQNGNWFLTASRDHLIKLYDIRNLKQERQVFRGHRKEAFTVAWHPIHEDMFASGGSEGSILFWQIGEDKDVGSLEGAHESLIWSLAWHPLGHILVSGSNDHSTKFWTRNRPGDPARERTNLHSNDDGLGITGGRMTRTHFLKQLHSKPEPATFEVSSNTDTPVIPGMGDADAAAADVAKREEEKMSVGIPGLDWSHEEKNEFDRKILVQQQENIKKKIPFARPVPRSFVAAWESKSDNNNPRHRYQRPQRSPSPLTQYAADTRANSEQQQRKSQDRRSPPPPPIDPHHDHHIRKYDPEVDRIRRHDSDLHHHHHHSRRPPPPPIHSRFDHRDHRDLHRGPPPSLEPIRGKGDPQDMPEMAPESSYPPPPPPPPSSQMPNTPPVSIAPPSVDHDSRPPLKDEDMRQHPPPQNPPGPHPSRHEMDFRRGGPPPSTSGFAADPADRRGFMEQRPPADNPEVAGWERPPPDSHGGPPHHPGHYDRPPPGPPMYNHPSDMQQQQQQQSGGPPPFEGIPPPPGHYSEAAAMHHHQRMMQQQHEQNQMQQQMHFDEASAPGGGPPPDFHQQDGPPPDHWHYEGGPPPPPPQHFGQHGGPPPPGHQMHHQMDQQDHPMGYPDDEMGGGGHMRSMRGGGRGHHRGGQRFRGGSRPSRGGWR